MITKVVLSCLAVGFVIFELKLFEALKEQSPVVPISEIDRLLAAWPNLDVQERVSFKMMLYKHGIIDENRWFNFQPVGWELMSERKRRHYKRNMAPRFF